MRQTPLWVRVDQNRAKKTTFVVAFVIGSAALLDVAFIGVPGALFGLLAEDFDAYYRTLGLLMLAGFAVLMVLGAMLAAVQLSNAEDWVRSRFKGRELLESEAPGFTSAVHDMALAAGLPATPRLLLFESDGESVNALALGKPDDPVIGVTRGLLDRLDLGEQRAVAATLIARITAGDVMFGTALAALMGPLKALRDLRAQGDAIAGATDACAVQGCGDPGCADGCTSSGCSGDGCAVGDGDDLLGCLGMAIFIGLVLLITYVAVVSAAWLVTAWGRLLQRTAYEKADAEGMLLLKDPTPMVSALEKAVATSNAAASGDFSYDGILYASASGKPGIDRVERRRVTRLREVLGVDGATHEVRSGI